MKGVFVLCQNIVHHIIILSFMTLSESCYFVVSLSPDLVRFFW